MSDQDLAPPDAELRALLLTRPVVAVVGASINPARPSHEVMEALIDLGYDAIPVNPAYPEVLGRKAYPDLASIPRRIDLVDVFRRAGATPDVARQAVAVGARVLWLQIGVVSEEARRIAAAAGLVVVMDRCLRVEHDRLVGAPFAPREPGAG